MPKTIQTRTRTIPNLSNLLLPSPRRVARTFYGQDPNGIQRPAPGICIRTHPPDSARRLRPRRIEQDGIRAPDQPVRLFQRSSQSPANAVSGPQSPRFATAAIVFTTSTFRVQEILRKMSHFGVVP